MKKLLLIAGLALFVGCEHVDPNWSKAATEKRQLEVAQEETELLKRIAVAEERQAKALESLADRF